MAAASCEKSGVTQAPRDEPARAHLSFLRTHGRDARATWHGRPAHVREPGCATRAGAANAALFRAAGGIGSRHVNPLLDLIANPDAVLPDLRAASGDDAIRALHARLGAAAGAVTDAPQFLADLLERARFSSVCIADDVALPHARTAAVGRMVLAVGRAAEGIAFDAEHSRVRLVFLIGTPRAAVTENLQVVAALSRLLKNPATRAALLAAPTEAELRALLQPSPGSGPTSARGAKR
jgi:mannitol/fructose-specific phosphotransferase system IIA component (Ntr-type)